jgi:TRAP-type mannitol/chloroaromatic compound transport system substrate-binding protein
MRHRNLVIAWIAFALPVLVLAAAIWRGPGDAAAQQKIVWKVQSTWPANNLLHISALELAKMVEDMSGGRLKWEMSAAGTVVPAFEVLDAVSRGIIDASHAWPGYWAGKNSAAGLFAPGPGGPFGMDREEYLGWLFAGGGLELYNEMLQKS